MDIDNKEFLAGTHQKFSTFKALSEQLGKDQAWEKMGI